MKDDGLTVRQGEPLARHFAWRTGGPCDVWVVARDLQGVAAVVADARKVDWKLTVVGAGTRTVVREGGVSGVVMRLAGELASPDLVEPGAGALLSVLVERAIREGKQGLEPFAAVPGTLGGSLLHDDGWDDLVEHVYVLQRGARRTMSLPDARRKHPVVLGARLLLVDSEPEAVRRRVDAVWRAGRPSSWYAGPRKTDVREVLTSVRLPLVRLRQVAIPAKAPELMVNLGSGTTADLLLLHRSAIERVAKVRGIDLASRIGLLGTEAS